MSKTHANNELIKLARDYIYDLHNHRPGSTVYMPGSGM